MAVRKPDEVPSQGTASIETWLETDGPRTFAIAYLITGDEGLAKGALQEALRSLETGPAVHEATLRSALRQGQKLPLDRFFLRALANPPSAGDLAGLRRDLADRLPEPERTALILHAVGGLAAAQIAALQRSTVPMVEGGLNRALERLGQLGDPASVWDDLRSALMVRVPPFPRGELNAGVRTEAEAMGAQAVPARRRPLLALLGVAAVAVLSWGILRLPVAQGVTRNAASPPSQPADVVTNQPGEPPVIAPLDLAPTRIFRTLPVFALADLAGLNPGAVVEFSTNMDAIQPWPITPERRVVAEKLFQWLSEADVLGPATPPGFGPGAYPVLRIRFQDGKDLLLQPEPSCFEGVNGCAILVGGEGQTPLRVRQTNLVRYLAAVAWSTDLAGQPVPALLPSLWQQQTRRTAEMVKEILAPTLAADGMQVRSLDPRTRLLQYQEATGRWSTSLAPIWVTVLESADSQKLRARVMVDDESGTVLFRQDIPVSS